MKEIIGLRVEKLDYELFKKGDLIYQDGPLVSHFININNENYLFIFCDFSDEFSRWLLTRAKNKNLLKFLDKEITLKDLILLSDENLIIDIDDNINYKRIFGVSGNIDNDYLPSDNSFFDKEFFEPYSLELKNSLINSINR